jgi:hypothetical protein
VRSNAQPPVDFGFRPRTTASDVLRGADVRGTIAIAPRDYSGVGLETTRALAERVRRPSCPRGTQKKIDTWKCC